MSNFIFIIGPGGAGKSTCGQILAQKIGYNFIDLDSEFMNQVGHIGNFIKESGYNEYCRQNSDLFYKLLDTYSGQKIIFVLSSGFFCYEIGDLKKRHLDSTQANGLSIMLMPSDELDICRQIIVERQMARGFNLNKEKETKTIIERFDIYKKLGDIKIFSAEPPKNIVEQMIGRLELASRMNDRPRQ